MGSLRKTIVYYIILMYAKSSQVHPGFLVTQVVIHCLQVHFNFFCFKIFLLQISLFLMMCFFSQVSSVLSYLDNKTQGMKYNIKH